MTPSITTKFVAAAALALAALGVASAAHARSDVQFSISFGIPPVYVQPGPVYFQPRSYYQQSAPIYVQPAPIYVQPRPVYFQPRSVYLQPAPIYVQPGPVYVQPTTYGYVYENGRDWRREKWERRHFRQRDNGWDRRQGRDWD